MWETGSIVGTDAVQNATCTFHVALINVHVALINVHVAFRVAALRSYSLIPAAGLCGDCGDCSVVLNS